jgi:methylenetetrahydrofolate reductase (NADPH)
MTTLSQTMVPQSIYDSLEPIKEDDQAVKDYGIQLAIEMCKKMKENGIAGFHFYTMNLERSIRLILEGLGWVAPVEITRPLPWNPVSNNNNNNNNSNENEHTNRLSLQ